MSLSRRISLTSAAIALSALSLPAFAEFENRSFSVFGAAGFEWVNYSEKLNRFGHTSVESEFNATNFVQRSGGYTAASPEIGFFIQTASTLIAQEKTEEWIADGYSSAIQQDTAAMSYSSIDVTLAYHLKNAAYFTVGLRHQKMAFSRFEWQNSPSTEAFADDLENYIRETPSLYNPIQQGISDGSFVDVDGNPITTEAEYFEATRFDPEQTQDVVFEDATSFSMLVGVGWDSYFIKQQGWRTSANLAIGTQMYEHVLNSTNERSLSRTFGGGLDVHGRLGVGYQFTHQIGTMLIMTANYSHRDEIEEKLNDTQTLRLPENDFYAVGGFLSMSWNFK